jgi:hypothetical protein
VTGTVPGSIQVWARSRRRTPAEPLAVAACRSVQSLQGITAGYFECVIGLAARERPAAVHVHARKRRALPMLTGPGQRGREWPSTGAHGSLGRAYIRAWKRRALPMVTGPGQRHRGVRPRCPRPPPSHRDVPRC